MLSSSQAEVIAEELLGQQRRSVVEARNAAARRVPRAFHVAGLDALEPWERGALARQAARATDRCWSAVGWSLGWAGLCLVTWYALGQFQRPTVAPLILALVCGTPIYFIRAFFVRRELRKQFAARNPIARAQRVEA